MYRNQGGSMKIISKPDISNWSYKYKCMTCDAELEIEDGDLAYEDGGQRDGDVYIAYCPCCNSKIYISTDKVPKLLGLQIRKRTNIRNNEGYYKK